jgi:hypothetical protein
MQRQVKAIDFIKRYSNIISMVTVPLLAFIFSLFYVRGKYNFTEHLVANMYSAGFTALVMAFIIIPLMSINNQHAYMVALIANIVFDIIYRGIFYYRFMNRPGTAAVIKALGVSLLAQTIIIAITFVLMFWYMITGVSGLFH